MGGLGIVVILLAFAAGAVVGYLAGRKSGGKAEGQPFSGNADPHPAAMVTHDATRNAHVPIDDWEAEARALARDGNKIQAIKLVRERTGLGLKEAKDYVERW